MEMPILEFPKYVDELCKDFEHLFAQERQMLQFKRLISGFAIVDKHTIAHMNGLFVYHTNQSNLNRFIQKSKWDLEEMNRIKINLINRMEGEEGVLILANYIIKKYGKNMYGVDYHFDHSEGKSVWGLQIADCVLSGKGIYPLLSTIYVRKDSRWDKKFKTKIEIQMEHLTQLCEMGLNFLCVVADTWYFNKDLTAHIEKMGKDWVAECKSNRLVLSKGKWIPLSEFANKINEEKFRVVEIGEDT